MTPSPIPRVTLIAASEKDRQAIYKIRYGVYGQELQQHPINAVARLTDDLDRINHYIVSKSEDKVVGFISITL